MVLIEGASTASWPEVEQQLAEELIFTRGKGILAHQSRAVSLAHKVHLPQPVSRRGDSHPWLLPVYLSNEGIPIIV